MAFSLKFNEDIMTKEHRNVGNIIEYVVEFYPTASHLLTLRERFLLLLRSMTEKNINNEISYFLQNVIPLVHFCNDIGHPIKSSADMGFVQSFL